MKNHDQELRNIGTANKNQKKHDFQTMVKENKEFMVFIGFSNVFLTKSSETLEKPIKTMKSYEENSKTLEKPIKTKKNMIFKLWCRKNKEFIVFIGFSNVSELLVKKTLEKPIKKKHNFLKLWCKKSRIHGFYWFFQCF